ncbi:MAG TPA: hypothetical protein VFS59_14275 [Gemmatimonadaceae bacterium]|nr:hypothetical protein [Gemmatimonadaceae bacterium]
MRTLLPLLQVLLVVTVLIWDVALTSRIVQVRTLPRPFVALTALAGFLLLPSLVIHLATTNAITGRSVAEVDWLWPFTLTLFALQALYAATRRLVNPFFGFFISAYDVLIAVDAVLRSIAATGTILPAPALLFLAATTGTFSFLLTSSTVISSPLFVLVPMIAPAFPALRRTTATFRLVLAFAAGAWVVIFITQLTPAVEAVNSYRIHDPRTEKLQERPDGDFEIGLKLFPDLTGPPPPVAIRNDIRLADTLEVSVVSVVIVPEEMSGLALDSLTNALDLIRRENTQLIVTLGYPQPLVPLPGRTFNDARRLRTIDGVVRRLRPDILIPAEDPYDSGTRAAGQRAPQFWQSYIARASAIAKGIRPRTRIGVSASAYDRRDSTLYAWAAAPGSPVDVVGFTLFPSRTGVRTLDAATHAADRWMRESRSTKDHWVFAAGGFPEAHGEVSQERAVWAALAWATSRPTIKGLIVSEAGDYGNITGLRAPDGHLRRATYAVMSALRGVREARVAAPSLRVQ